MKKLVICLVSLVVFSGVSFANDSENCKSIANFAAVVMEKRQAGTAMDAMIDLIHGSESDNGLRKVLESIILRAYENPRYGTEEFKKRSVNDFRNDIYVECYRSTL